MQSNSIMGQEMLLTKKLYCVIPGLLITPLLSLINFLSSFVEKI